MSRQSLKLLYKLRQDNVEDGLLKAIKEKRRFVLLALFNIVGLIKKKRR